MLKLCFSLFLLFLLNTATTEMMSNDVDFTTRLKTLFGDLDKRHYFKFYYGPTSYNDQLVKYLRGRNDNRIFGKYRLGQGFRNTMAAIMVAV